MRVLLLWLAALPVFAAVALPPMNEPQKATYTKLCQELLAPCCYGGTLTGHQSGAADEVRARVANEIVAGKTPDEIRAGLVQTYGERILAFKSADRQSFYLFAVPAVVLAAGLIWLAFYVRRMRSRPAPVPDTGAAAPPLDDEDW